MSLEQFGLQNPEMLVLFAAIPVLLAIFATVLVARGRRLSAFAGIGAGYVSGSVTVRAFKYLLTLATLAALIVAVAGPQFGLEERIVRREGIDVVFAVDTSQSMAARDATPDRLQAAQAFVARVGEQLAGDRVGLVLFAGDGIKRFPLTPDAGVLGAVLDASGRGFRPAPGSSLRAGLEAALGTFPPELLEGDRPKAIVFLSDGEGPVDEPFPYDRLRELNVTLFTVGIGTELGGEIPTFDPAGNFDGMLRDIDGQLIVSRLDEGRLIGIAANGGGRYWRFSGAGPAPDELVDVLRGMATTEIEREVQLRPENRFQIFAVIALAFLLLEWLLSDTRPMPRPKALV